MSDKWMIPLLWFVIVIQDLRILGLLRSRSKTSDKISLGISITALVMTLLFALIH